MTTLPDTFGLPEYFVSNIATEADGPNVRIVCGVNRGGQVHWLFSYVMRADLVASQAGVIRGAAEEALAGRQRTNPALSSLN